MRGGSALEDGFGRLLRGALLLHAQAFGQVDAGGQALGQLEFAVSSHRARGRGWRCGANTGLHKNILISNLNPLVR